jgi:hypothetical protein
MFHKSLIFIAAMTICCLGAIQSQAAVKCTVPDQGRGLYASTSQIIEGKFKITNVYLRTAGTEPRLAKNAAGLLEVNEGVVNSLIVEKRRKRIVEFSSDDGYTDQSGNYEGSCQLQGDLKKWTCSISAASNAFAPVRTMTFVVFDVPTAEAAERLSLEQCASKSSDANGISYEAGMRHCRKLADHGGLTCSSVNL